ncbi:hypothetical protein BH11MYX1_BH11MYX1_10680 [soil metagenome]
MADEPERCGDDLEVGALRRVFSAMREADEEPPRRGLADLLAAARAHAPQPVSWWQRFTNVLRQPPMLALATIAILVGGALVIVRPDASIEHGVPSAAPHADPKSSAGPPPNTAPITAPVTAPVTAPRDLQGERARADAPAPAVSRPRMQRPSGDAIGAARAPESENAAPQKAETVTRPAAQTSGALLLHDLFDQASAAAARGDCETARALAMRVARQDLGYYRDRVTTDDAVTKCLN